MADYIAPIQRLIEQFRRLPGVGAKTAARYAFATLNLSEEECCDFADAISGVKRDVHKCPVCHGLSASTDGCDICTSPARDSSVV
ncbi:MAG: recombination protein RecR, partial [Clostridia bacterium]|nr:recombination protein RecR [Clostridia bacterium]